MTIEQKYFLLSFNSRENTRSFIERYVEIIEKKWIFRSLTDINKQIGKLNEFYKRKMKHMKFIIIY